MMSRADSIRKKSRWDIKIRGERLVSEVHIRQ